MKRKLFAGILISIFVLALNIFAQKRNNKTSASVGKIVLTPVRCDETLWRHVYIGDRRKFDTAEDRLKVIDRCKTVTGTIVYAAPEGDGDYHLRLRLDPGQQDLLNAKNRRRLPSGQGGNLVVEPICQKNPTQANTIEEGVCNRLRQNLPAMAQIKANIRKKKGTRVEVTGAFVTDMEHGWNEIHPVTSIIIK